MMGKQNIAILWQFYGDAVFIAERKFSSAWPPRRRTLDFQVYKFGNPDHFSAKQILDGIIDNCKRSVIYTSIADESTNVTDKEKISIWIRFVGRKEDGKHFIREEFLTFVHVDKGPMLRNKISRDIQDRRPFSEWYESPRIWCHQCDEWTREWPANTDTSNKPKFSKLPRVRDIMHTMQEVTFAFKFCKKRLLVFKRITLQTILDCC